MKKLSIIIPYHGEPRESVSPLLLSLNSQKNINFNDIEILINNDSTNDNISDVLELCDNLKDVSIITRYNGGGPGPSRQHCLDNSQGDYILFFDADDTLLTNTTLSKILNIITSGMDVYNFKELLYFFITFDFFRLGIRCFFRLLKRFLKGADPIYYIC